MYSEVALRVATLTLASTFLMAGSASEQPYAQPASNTLAGRAAPGEAIDLSSTLILVADGGWSGGGVCSDCSSGWSDDVWELTLSESRVVTFLIEDCCIVGDIYELWVDGKRVGTTSHVFVDGPSASTGRFTLTLKGGTHRLQVRNTAFLSFPPDVLERMCPSGFYFSWAVGNVPNPWWTGVVNTISMAAKRIGLTAAELFARLNDLGEAWSTLVAGWQLKKAGQLGEQFNTPDYRARLIDEAYNSGGKNPIFMSRVDEGVDQFCFEQGCAARSWNDLSFQQKRDEDLWLSVCATVGGGFCSGYLLPAFAVKWLE